MNTRQSSQCGSAVSGAASLLALVLGTGLLCCAYEEMDDGGLVVWDSAGVEIVETSGRGDWKGSDRLMVSDRALVELGDASGDNFAFDRVSDALVLDDSLFVVANRGSGELVFFDSDGDWLYTVGRIGSGRGNSAG